jgi:prepilin-type processing-associated H-X9-DG protein
MGHEPIELSAFLDGELSPGECRRVEQRLATDPAYAEELRRMEGTRRLAALCLEQPDFHGRLMMAAFAQSQAQHRHRAAFKSLLMVAAVVVVVAAWLIYLPGAMRPAPTRIPVAGNQLSDAHLPEDATHSEPGPPADSRFIPSSSGDGEYPPFIEVAGIETENPPVAMLKIIVNGEVKTEGYLIGDEILPGYRLVAIDGEAVTLGHNGDELVVGVGRGLEGGELDRLTGLWRLQIYDDKHLVKWMLVSATRLSRESIGLSELQDTSLGWTGRWQESSSLGKLTYSWHGHELHGEFKGKTGNNTIHATFSPAWNKATIRYEGANNELQRTALVERATSADARALDFVSMLEFAYDDLEEFARTHDGFFPVSTEMLALTGGAPHLLFEAYEDEAKYYEERTLPCYIDDRAMPHLPGYEPPDTYSDRLKAYEQELRSSGLRLVEDPEKLFELRDARLGVVAVLFTNGQVEVDYPGKPPEPVGDLAELRKACQENLKDIGYFIRLFADEHHGYSPPGWLSIYPEYFTNPELLTSSKDTPHSDSYRYLLPATHLADYMRQASIDWAIPPGSGDVAGRIPILVNRTDWPGPQPGRNVLFVDGHVEYVLIDSEKWRNEIAPFIH